MLRIPLVALLCLLVLPGCASTKSSSSDNTVHARAKTSRAILTYEGFATPESVLYDAEADLYLVSNVNGSPFAKDGNGFISRLSPKGEILELKWIDGATEGVTLHAPKGLAVENNRLWVTDIDHMRIFNRHTGKHIASLVINRATFLNAVTVGPDGAIYFSDSGLKEGFAPSGSDAVYRVEPPEAALAMMRATLVDGDHLGRPNGLGADEDALYTVTFGSGELIRIVGHDIKYRHPLRVGGLDGLILLANGDFLISSWDAQAVFMGNRHDGFQAVVTNVEAPADIGFDSKRKRILVPLFKQHRVEVYKLP